MAAEKDDMFAELAKVKSEPKPLKIEVEGKAPEMDDEGEGQLTVDVYQDKNDIIVQSTVAGVNPDDLEINITNESVVIKGKEKKPKLLRTRIISTRNVSGAGSPAQSSCLRK